MGLWLPHCGLSNERALSPQVPPFLSLLIEQPPHFVLGKWCILLLLHPCVNGEFSLLSRWEQCFLVGLVFTVGLSTQCFLSALSLGGDPSSLRTSARLTLWVRGRRQKPVSTCTGTALSTRGDSFR